MSRIRVLSVIVLVMMVTSCHSSSEILKGLNLKYFGMSGSLLVGKMIEVTTKELLLDGGKLTGKDVGIQGDIVIVAEYNTYFVMSDESGRILVKLTGMANQNVKVTKGDHIKVWGTVERGKKGLPLIVAIGIKN